MNYASRTKRFALPSCTGLLIVIALAGCQSGGQSDLVSRELRMQEDQIYAMEDYLSQYQQLLCEMRAENAALKRQLADARGGETLPAPAATRNESSRVRERTPARGPAFRAPASEEPQTTTPETEIIEPEIPPLNTTQNRGQNRWGQNRGRGRPGSLQEDLGMHYIVRGQSPDGLSESPIGSVIVRGEVMANDMGGGPRLVVDVEPISATGKSADTAAAVSLMLLEPQHVGPPRSLARWDYSAADAEANLRESSDGSSARVQRYYLELPSNVPTDRKTELWVRMVPEGGEKVLANVPVNLRRPGPFGAKDIRAQRSMQFARSSVSEDSAEVAQQITGSKRIEPKPIKSVPVRRRDDEGWSLARPDRPASSANGLLNGENDGWRVSSRPIPVVERVAETKRPVVTRPVVQQAAYIEAARPSNATPPATPAPAEPPVKRTAPVWTAERNTAAGVATKQNDASRATAGPVRPVWSPLR